MAYFDIVALFLMTIGIVLIMAVLFILFKINKSSVRDSAIVRGYESNEYINTQQLMNMSHKQRINRIIDKRDNQKVMAVINHPHCSNELKSRISRFFDKKSGIYFMRYVDLYDFELELGDLIKSNQPN